MQELSYQAVWLWWFGGSLLIFGNLGNLCLVALSSFHWSHSVPVPLCLYPSIMPCKTSLPGFSPIQGGKVRLCPFREQPELEGLGRILDSNPAQTPQELSVGLRGIIHQHQGSNLSPSCSFHNEFREAEPQHLHGDKPSFVNTRKPLGSYPIKYRTTQQLKEKKMMEFAMIYCVEISCLVCWESIFCPLAEGGCSILQQFPLAFL